MKLQKEVQRAEVSDVARARIALSLPVLKGVLFALQRDRVARLGGYEDYVGRLGQRIPGRQRGLWNLL